MFQGFYLDFKKSYLPANLITPVPIPVSLKSFQEKLCEKYFVLGFTLKGHYK